MGAENLSQIRRWRQWTQIFHMIPIAVFDRPPYSLKSQLSLAARRFGRYRVGGTALFGLATARPPCWGFFHTPLNAISSTAIRLASTKGIDHRNDR
jgi:nicotinate-nucleotide adenylyltransferase